MESFLDVRRFCFFSWGTKNLRFGTRFFQILFLRLFLPKAIDQESYKLLSTWPRGYGGFHTVMSYFQCKYEGSNNIFWNFSISQFLILATEKRMARSEGIPALCHFFSRKKWLFQKNGFEKHFLSTSEVFTFLSQEKRVPSLMGDLFSY